ncbi:ABC transporter ATP-binding protein [Bacillus altitudinis]|uniref:ABC transporter ATP-binding protein n=1 Tax=Bacillus altitudinis TaxID=293387 RepID=A0A653Y903_BACAB|nr:ABC transporter ATP-binding protein [Bacillus altitudinis]MBX7000549.1 ABC transporter ATP-binding protein [Bacillus aerophilus]MBX7015699.1 ABC transporter ATP-binding protein [Bacillus aerophilus]MCY7629641.1 ABC transporter ATP-binding protein [Bacillus altitudinis]MDM5165107.1 ABC transporter ATP-binding protein [Bacillus altitudinis]MDX2365922.1 ABC transporter ATP-binding protein [Bacillus altitudinis]
MLHTKGLTKKYRTKVAIDHIDLDIHQGDIFGLIGPKGAGKTTFFNIITGISRPTSGTFIMMNMTSLKKVRHHIGVLPEYTDLYEGLTAIEHIAYLSKITGTRQKTSYYEELLEFVGLHRYHQEKVGAFTPGMKKRLGMAQAIAHQPDFILLDEPFADIDADSILHIQRVIESLKFEGKTVFLTADESRFTQPICTKTAFISEGKIVSSSTHPQEKTITSSTIRATFKHAWIDDEVKPVLTQYLQSVGTDLVIRDDETSLLIRSEAQVPAIIRAFVKCKVDLYRVTAQDAMMST